LHITEPERPKPPTAAIPMTTDQLEPDMVLAKDLVSTTGVLMLTAGQSVNALLIRRIREFELREGGKLVLHIRPRGQG
jgi:hypothetical protein